MIEIKTGEKLFVGNAVIMSQDGRARLYIEGEAPVIRQKDRMSPEQADTVAKRLYYIVQQIYLSQNSVEHLGAYKFAVQDYSSAHPQARARVSELGTLLEGGELFKALRLVRQLIDEEKVTADLRLEKPSRKAVPGAAAVLKLTEPDDIG
jgi:flagellar protein FlbT